MKKLTLALGLLVLLGSTGIATADVVIVSPGVSVDMTVAYPGFRVVHRPGFYCWYHGHYYTRAGWDHYRRVHPYHYHHHDDHR
jgi:hypothetical protein